MSWKPFISAVAVLLFLNDSCNAQRRRLGAGVSQVEFDCPEEFGYYAHPTDCTQYYVCVFGGALLESCTGGLMYSHELQTCDWPRNVGCNSGGESPTVSTIRVTDPRTRHTTPAADGRSVRPSPSPVPVTVQTRNQEQDELSKAQYPLYTDEVGPAEEQENERQQRVYRGQPATVGQVARDRDGLRHAVTNSIPSSTSGRVASDKIISYTGQQQQYSFDHLDDPDLTENSLTNSTRRFRRQIRFRPDPSRAPVYSEPAVQVSATPSSRPVLNQYNSSQFGTQYDPYYALYDEDVELYRDVDYSQYSGGQNTYSGQRQQQPQQPQQPQQQQNTYTGGRANTFSQPSYRPEVQNVYTQSVGSQDYNDYNSQDEQLQYRQQQSTRAPPRNRNRARGPSSVTTTHSTPYTTTSTYAPESPTPRRVPSPTRQTIRVTTTALPARNESFAYLTRNSESIPRGRVVYQNNKSTQSSSPLAAASRSRGGASQSSSNSRSKICSETDSYGGCGRSNKPQVRVRPTTASPESQSTTVYSRENNSASRNRGSASYVSSNAGSSSSGRSRPTLKPSTAIVSKASEYIDIYRFPPNRPPPVYPQPRTDQPAAKCRRDICLLPDCSCGGKEVPGGFEPEQIPQIVLLTFDDSVNDLNKELYKSIFEKGRRNANGCPISGTFYVSHEWTDYSQVQNLYADGHEIASHSISHSFGEQFSQKKWTKEIAGQREILSAYGGVRLEDIRGMRAPFLAIGGNKMFKMLYDANFTYDSSMPIYENRPPSWPYTLDYKVFHDCMIPPCPTRSYPGVWEVPMVMWQDLNGGRCSMGDACSNPPTADGVYKMLIKNFERHYTTNRAPFGLYYHAAWFTQPHHKEGFLAFLDTITSMEDVWLVTNWQAIQWMRDPTPLSRINNFRPWQCNYPERPRRCNNPKVCNLWHKSGVRYMRTCQPCPDIYPWTGKTGVRNSRVDNEIDE